MKRFRNSFDNYKWVMLFLAFLISFLLHLLLFGTAPMFDQIMNEMNISNTEFGFIFFMAMVSLVVLRIPWGFLIDKFGYSKILKFSLPIISALAIIRSFSPNYLVLLAAQFGLGLGLASILPCLPPLVKEWISSRTGFGTGIYVSGFAVGNGTALGLTPILLKTMEWRAILLIYGFVALAVTLLWWLLSESSVEESPSYEFENLSKLLKDRYVWVLTFFLLACMGSYDTLATWIPKVLTMKSFERWPASFIAVGFLLSGPIIGHLSDEFESERNLIAALGISATGLILVLIFATGLVLIPLIFGIGFLIMGVLTLTLKAPARHDRLSSSAGTVSALTSSLGNLGPAIIPVAFGYFIDLTGTYIISLLLVGSIVISTFLIGSIFWE